MRLLLVAGEVSGDHHAASLLEALAPRVDRLDVVGVGGDRCAALGMRLLAHQKELAVVGLVEALGKLRFARRLLGRLVEEATRPEAPVDGAVLVDSPDFNLPLARRLARRGVPVVFYVSPQVWAWRSGRARTITELGRAVLVLFGFEKRWYDARGLGAKVTWVGHPLVDAVREELTEAPPEPPPPDGARRVVLMPGSRAGEVARHLPLLRDAARLLRERYSALEIVLVRADSIPESLLAEHSGTELARWRVVSGAHLALLAASDVLLVASGTATVEGLLTGVPMVVVYRVHGLTFFLAKRFVRVPHVAMANLVSDDGTGRRVAVELIQADATPERLAKEAAALLDDPARVASIREAMRRGAEDLGSPGAAVRTADALLAALGAHGVRTAPRRTDA